MTPHRALALAGACASLLVASMPAHGEGCSRRFDTHTTGLPAACIFVGRLTPLDERPVIATFAGDGVVLVISLVVDRGETQLFYPARVSSDIDAELVRWQPGLDLATAAPQGIARLEKHGHRLRVRLDRGAAAPAIEFQGNFAGMASMPLPLATAATR